MKRIEYKISSLYQPSVPSRSFHKRKICTSTKSKKKLMSVFDESESRKKKVNKNRSSKITLRERKCEDIRSEILAADITRHRERQHSLRPLFICYTWYLWCVWLTGQSIGWLASFSVFHLPPSSDGPAYSGRFNVLSAYWSNSQWRFIKHKCYSRGVSSKYFSPDNFFIV